MQPLGMLSAALSSRHMRSLGDIGNDIRRVLATLDRDDLSESQHARHVREHDAFIEERSLAMASIQQQELAGQEAMQGPNQNDTENNGNEQSELRKVFGMLHG